LAPQTSRLQGLTPLSFPFYSKFLISTFDIEIDVNSEPYSAALVVKIQDLVTGGPEGTVGICSSVPIQGVTGNAEASVFTISVNAPYTPCSSVIVQVQLSGSNEALSITISHSVNSSFTGVVQRLATYSTGSIGNWYKYVEQGNTSVVFMAPMNTLPTPTSENLQALAGWTGDQLSPTLPVDPSSGAFRIFSYEPPVSSKQVEPTIMAKVVRDRRE
jgi:hypothetical protein